MTFAPALPVVWLLAVGMVVVVARGVALQRVLSHSVPRKRGRAVLRWAGLTLATLCVLAAAARPGIDTGRDTTLAVQSSESSDLNVFLVVDRSAQAPVTDMRADMNALIDEYPDARFALISFATRATVDWPVSDDVSSFRSLVSGLSAYVVTSPESGAQANAFAARDVLYTKAAAATGEYPGSRNLVFYLGTGTPESAVARGDFELPPGTVDGGAVFGYGATDEARLQEIADGLGVQYSARRGGQPVADLVPPPGEVGSGESGSTVEVADRYELYWALALLAAALVLAEMTLTLREYRRTRASRREVTR
jgi:hypothetical protein